MYNDAYGVKPTDKLKRKIERIQQYIQEQSVQSPEATSSPRVATGSARNMSESSGGFSGPGEFCGFRWGTSLSE